MVVISDTSAITNLIKIGRLSLLKDVFKKVIIPSNVEKELLDWKDLGADISDFENADWIEVFPVEDLKLLKKLKVNLDDGEAAAIVLAKEVKADYLIIDERKGWKTAKSMGISAVGLIGVLLKAKSQGIIDKIMPILDELISDAGFWISEAFYNKIKKLAKE